MKRFNTFVENLKFKHIIIIYLIVAVIIGLAGAGALCYVYRDNISFAVGYKKLVEKFEKNDVKLDTFKSDIDSLAGKTSDIIDILVLDKDNNLLYSTDGTKIAWDTTFELQKDKDNGYFTSAANADVVFRLVDNEELVLPALFHDEGENIGHEHKNDVFYKDNFNTKKVYTLSYAINNQAGLKIYFIGDAVMTPYGVFTIALVSAAAMLVFMFYWVLLALWVYGNARKSRLSAPLWGIITLLTNFVGLIVYLLYKYNNTDCPNCNASQSKYNLFCTNCGTKLSDNCQKCGAAVSGKDLYCGKCGTKADKK